MTRVRLHLPDEAEKLFSAEKKAEARPARNLFAFSILFLTLLFAALLGSIQFSAAAAGNVFEILTE